MLMLLVHDVGDGVVDGVVVGRILILVTVKHLAWDVVLPAVTREELTVALLNAS